MMQSVPRKQSLLVWAMLVIVLAETALCLRERALRFRAEGKMRAAYLELNDVRGEYLAKRENVIRSSSELRELRNAKLGVEEENLAKEKRIAELTKKLHELELERLEPSSK